MVINMPVLGLKTEKYAYPCYPWQDDEKGFYFSDATMDPFIAQAKLVTKDLFELHLAKDGKTSGLSPLNRHRLLIPEPQLLWEESCDMVVEAFEKFDPRLGAKAREVIDNPARWKLNQVSHGDAGGFCCPANCESNLNLFAIIEYNYEGTINDAVYIAHELGHLIADDYIHEAGFTYKDSKRHMLETQAFFTQHILYDFLSNHSDSKLRQAGQNHFIGEITRSLYNLPIGIGALEAEKRITDGDRKLSSIKNSYINTVEAYLGSDWKKYKKADRLERHILDSKKRDNWGICDLHQHSMASIIAAGLFNKTVSLEQESKNQMLDILLGKEGPKSINDIFEEAGVKTKLDIDAVAKNAISYIRRPLETWNKPDNKKSPAIVESIPTQQYP